LELFGKFIWGGGEQWELDENSNPGPFKNKIKNIPWGHIGTTQLALLAWFYPTVLWRNKLLG